MAYRAFWAYWLAVALVLPAVVVRDAGAVNVCPAPHFKTIPDGTRYGFPPKIEEKGLVYARKRIPISRSDVRSRILKEINYLLMDRRSRVLLWLSRADHLRSVILPILRKYHLPSEFIYLAAIESSYNSRALSSAGAFGYWQFIKSTARRGPSNCDKYDWRMDVNKWNDERGDLVHSTHSAARYLAWINRVMKVKLKGLPERQGLRNWLLAAASYNAGPARVMERLNSFGARSYWDVPLPLETERYVPRWIAVGIISRNRDFYGVRIPGKKSVTYDTVRRLQLRKDLTIDTIARLLGTTPRTIWSLNTKIAPEKGVFPAKTRKGRLVHRINIPRGSRKKFLAQLKAHGYLKRK
jgi:membrane-bound lytic murein transglycosylase D